MGQNTIYLREYAPELCIRFGGIDRMASSFLKLGYLQKLMDCNHYRQQITGQLEYKLASYI